MEEITTKIRQKLDAFVSMPFSPQFEDVYLDGIWPVNEFLKDIEINWKRLDKEAYKERQIESNVLKNIDNSDILLADISRYPDTDSPNVSVMHEIGYASGKGVPFVLIGKKNTHKKLPSNLKGSIIAEYDSESKKDLDNFVPRLARQIQEELDKQIFPLLKGGFRVEGFIGRPKLNLPYLIEKAKTRIAILTTNLNYTDLYLKKSIMKALGNNKANPEFKVEILTMDPESDVANARSLQLGSTSIRKYRNLLRESYDNIKDEFKDYKNVDLLTYQTLPTQMTFFIDKIIIVAIVSLGQKSREGVHFVLNNKDAAHFDNHFTLIKNQAIRRE